MIDIRTNTFTTISDAINGTTISKIINGRVETESTVETNEDFSLLTNAMPIPLLGESCIAGYIYRDNDITWNCIQTHNRTIYDLVDTPALFKQYFVQCVDWYQPINEYDAYNIGDTCLFNGDYYKSIIDVNTWSPTGYPQGWELTEKCNIII